VPFTLYGKVATYLDTYHGNVAINVKCRTLGHWLPDKINAEFLKLDRRSVNIVTTFAYTTVQEDWWDWAKFRVRELELGEIWQGGRSGGWLVFRLTESGLRDRLEEAESACRFCGYPFSVHVEGKCPFEASSFETADPDTEKFFESLCQFGSDVKNSFSTLHERFVEEVLFQLEYLDDGTYRIPSVRGSDDSVETGTKDVFEE
jgi:hypothetical protein